MANPKLEIAIIGGGPAAIATALALTESPDDGRKIQITIYQPGWRLGGKCASGHDGRIEEHGLHVWAGYYDQAFCQAQKCFEELGLDWSAAFTPCRDVVLQDRSSGSWQPWAIRMPSYSNDLPGCNAGRRTWWDILGRLLKLLRKLVRDDAGLGLRPVKNLEDLQRAVPLLVEGFGEVASGAWGPLTGAQPPTVANIADVIEQLQDHLTHESGEIGDRQQEAVAALIDTLTPNLDALEAEPRLAGFGDDWSGVRQGLRLGWIIAKGVFRDRLLFRGFEHVDGEELLHWLDRHGANRQTLDSAIVRAGYDWAFAYHDGKPCISAGVALHGFLRLLLDYDKAPFWRMNGSMADVVLLPMYRVLERRGVRFRFFHRLTKMRLDGPGDEIEVLEFRRQVRLPGGGYDPVPPPRDGAGEFWPGEPHYEKIENGEVLQRRLRDRTVDLESGADTDDWEFSGGDHRLVRRASARDGDDVFDAVILAIPPEAQQRVAVELRDRKQPWRDMLRELRCAKTAAMQLWFLPALPVLVRDGSGKISTAFESPFSTWADMSHVLRLENWPEAAPPQALLYLCGNLPDDFSGDPKLAEEELRVIAGNWLEANARHLWPNAAPGKGPGFHYDELYDEDGRPGKERFEFQYVRANVRPSDGYVLSLPGTAGFRLEPGGSGVRNLFLAGDWVRTSLNAGCVEATFLAGRDAARAALEFLGLGDE